MQFAAIEFGRPWFALGLVALVVVYLLHLLRLHVRSVPVAAFDLWLEVSKKLPSATWRALAGIERFLICQLLLVAFICLALTEPAWVDTADGGTAVCVFDLGPGMQSVDTEGHSRLERAKAEALRLLENLPAGMNVRTLAVGDSLVSAPETETIGQARKRIEELTTGTQPTQADSVRSLALSMAVGPNTQVFVFTDKPIRFETEPLLHAPTVIRITDKTPNIGIVELSADVGHNLVLVGLLRRPGSPDSVDVTVTYEGSAGTSQETATLRFGNNSNFTSKVFSADLAKVRRITAEITHNDSLASDNTARIERLSGGHLRIALVGNVGRLVEEALRNCPDTLVTRGGSPNAVADMAVYGGTVPSGTDAPPPVIVLLDMPGPWGPFKPQRLETPKDVPMFLLAGDSKNDFGFDPKGMQLPLRQFLDPTPGVTGLVGNGDVLAVAWADTDGVRALFVGLDTSDKTRWGYDPEFPLFWLKVVETARRHVGRSGGFRPTESLLSRQATSSIGTSVLFDPTSIRKQLLTRRRRLDWIFLILAAGVLSVYWWLRESKS